MKKMLLVLCVVMLAGTIASAQMVSPTVYDRTFYGYCNGPHLVLQKLAKTGGVGTTKVYVGGYEDLVDACLYPYNAPLVGQKHAIGLTVPPRPYDGGLAGNFLDVGSAATDAICLCFSGYQEEWMADVKNNWVAGYYSILGFDGDYIFSVDTLTNGLPSKTGNAVGKPVLGGGGNFKPVKK